MAHHNLIRTPLPSFPFLGENMLSLYEAAREGNYPGLRLALRGHLEDIDKPDADDKTALYHAVSGGHLGCCSYLLRMNADPYAKRSNGNFVITEAFATLTGRKKKRLIAALVHPYLISEDSLNNLNRMDAPT